MAAVAFDSLKDGRAAQAGLACCLDDRRVERLIAPPVALADEDAQKLSGAFTLHEWCIRRRTFLPPDDGGDLFRDRFGLLHNCIVAAIAQQHEPRVWQERRDFSFVHLW